MNEHSVTPGSPAPRAAVFFWITIVLLALLLLGGAGAVVLLIFQAADINRSGGWGWLLVIGIFVVAIAVVCALCAVCTTVSLLRREPHRRLSIAILVISGLVVLATSPIFIRAGISVFRQDAEANRASQGTSPANNPSRLPSAADQGLATPLTPGLLALKSNAWEAIRVGNAGAFVDCFHVEERFNTPENRAENLKQVETLLMGKTIDVEIGEIPAKELSEIMKIQNAKPASLVRYSLVPKMMLRIRQEMRNGTSGRNFLIGEQNGKWYIITLAGHTM